MTTIAFDGVTLAADRCSWSDGIRRRARKLLRLKAPDGTRYLIAWTGNQAFATAVLEWMKGRIDQPDHRFFGCDPEGYCAIVIDERKRVWKLTNTLIYIRFHEKRFAGGAGHEVAWGALEAGATAVQAVRIAAKRSNYSALGVDTVRF